MIALSYSGSHVTLGLCLSRQNVSVELSDTLHTAKTMDEFIKHNLPWDTTYIDEEKRLVVT